ncbi:hypothetical protein CKO31_13500 [Thiohalocapsa halophila]|uniref:HAD hydrolase-like protein n=1 Tax=Thiohalocapsa halophila TaxID=69359 RepID=A0ABS1CIL3_9GAMM|nr:HAD hydrolase-like protein [Thiohalocapsa halophila]MBK1631742.1 hypothetical protein [Thiohalocapsa halophila]
MQAVASARRAPSRSDAAARAASDRVRNTFGVAAQDCVMVGDRPVTDIAGAVYVGMRAALVRPGRFAT